MDVSGTLTVSSLQVTGSITGVVFNVESLDLSGTLTAAEVDLDGGNVDNTIIGATTAATGNFTDLTASAGSFSSSIATGGISGTLVTTYQAQSNKAWETLTSLVANTVDINGGTLDSVAIGGSVSSTARFSNLKASNLDISTVDVSGILTAVNVDLNGGNVDSVAIGVTTSSIAQFTEAVSSLRLSGVLTGDVLSGVEMDSAELSGTLTANNLDVITLATTNSFVANTVDIMLVGRQIQLPLVQVHHQQHVLQM